jgi:hypothetical protein
MFFEYYHIDYIQKGVAPIVVEKIYDVLALHRTNNNTDIGAYYKSFKKLNSL